MKRLLERTVIYATLMGGVLAGNALAASAQTTLWRVGKEDNARTEFSASVDPANYTVPGDWSTRNAFPEWAGLSSGDWDSERNLDSTISYNLSSVPNGGAEFQFKTLNASQHVPELAVFSNGYLCGIIQMVGTRWFWDGSMDKGVPFGDLFRVYIPREFLRAGTNTLRLKKLEHPFSTDSSSRMAGANFAYLSFEYDYFKLLSLSSQPNEPIHSRYVNLGASTQPDSGQFSVNSNDVNFKPQVLKWLGLAYSGNIERAGFWRNVAWDQPRRWEYLQMLRDMNMLVLMDHYSQMRDPSQTTNSNDWTVDASGNLLSGPRTEITNFWNTYKNYFQYYELSNEPTMQFSNESFSAHKVVADYLNTIKPASTRIVAPGYNYGFQNYGSPAGWDRDNNLLRDLETRVQATNGHSYGNSYWVRDGNSLGETIDTYKSQFPNGFVNGFPKEFVNSEFGTADGWADEFHDIPLSERKATLFDRITRAHLAFGSKSVCYGANDHGGGFQLFDGALSTPSAWTYHLDATDPAQTPRMKIFRQYALAYSTHGRPIPFTFLNPGDVQNKLVYVRAVDTSAISALPNSFAKSNKVLLNFVNFDKVSQNVSVRFTMPIAGTYSGERFGAQNSYNAARSNVSFNANRTVDISVVLGPRESVQYILTRPTGSVAVGADAVVTSIGTTSTLKVGTPTRFTATVKNQGTQSTPIDTLAVAFFLNGASSPVTWNGIGGTLAPGQSVTLTSDHTWTPTTAGTLNIAAIVDDVNRFPETSETNNSRTQSFTVAN